MARTLPDRMTFVTTLLDERIGWKFCNILQVFALSYIGRGFVMDIESAVIIALSRAMRSHIKNCSVSELREWREMLRTRREEVIDLLLILIEQKVQSCTLAPEASQAQQLIFKIA